MEYPEDGNKSQATREATREAIMEASVKALNKLWWAGDEEFEHDFFETHRIDATKKNCIAVTLNIEIKEDMSGWEWVDRSGTEIPLIDGTPINDPLALTIIIEDTYTGQAAFHNPETGEIERVETTPEQQEAIDSHARRIGRLATRTYQLLRDKMHPIENFTELDDTSLNFLLMHSLMNSKGMVEEMERRKPGEREDQLKAMARCLETADEIIIDFWEKENREDKGRQG